jgi:hypothetical protein
MYTSELKAAVVTGLRRTFTTEYPQQDFRAPWCSIEYPVEKANYPAVWVNWEDTQEVEIAGIGHVEYVEDEHGAQHEVTRSKFGGVVTMTVAALSSWERDRLYDELVRIMVFAHKEPSVSAFRALIEHNELIAMNGDFDKVQPGGDSAAPGTPWGTDEWIYERSLSFNIIGEFVSHYDQAIPGLLRRIQVKGWMEGTPEPAFSGHPAGDVLDPGRPGSSPEGFSVAVPPPFDPGEWH